MHPSYIRGLNASAPAIDDASFFPEGANPLPTAPQVMDLRYYPDPILRQKCEPVVYSDAIKMLAANMLVTMFRKKGIGLAAPQVGYAIRMFVVDVEWPQRQGEGLEDSKSYCFINPAIVSRSAETVRSIEGCLSFPGGVEIEKARAKSIVVHALDINGEAFTLEAEGLLSVCIQHEFDHIEGHTFIDEKGFATRSLAKKAVAKYLKFHKPVA